jgi:hypothetical protein
MSRNSKMETRGVSEGSEGIDLQTEYFAVGGGDLRIAQLFEEARAAGYEVREPLSRHRADDTSGFRPPGYISKD